MIAQTLAQQSTAGASPEPILYVFLAIALIIVFFSANSHSNPGGNE